MFKPGFIRSFFATPAFNGGRFRGPFSFTAYSVAAVYAAWATAWICIAAVSVWTLVHLPRVLQALCVVLSVVISMFSVRGAIAMWRRSNWMWPEVSPPKKRRRARKPLRRTLIWARVNLVFQVIYSAIGALFLGGFAIIWNVTAFGIGLYHAARQGDLLFMGVFTIFAYFGRWMLILAFIMAGYYLDTIIAGAGRAVRWLNQLLRGPSEKPLSPNI